MFSLRQDALLLSLRPFDSLRLLPEAGDRRTWSSVDRAFSDQLGARAERALAAAYPRAAAGDFRRFLRNGTGPWLAAYTFSRERLKALALGSCVQGTDRFTEAAADQIYALCEESDWSLRLPVPDYPDFTHALIDVNACETGALLAVSVCLLRERLAALSPRIAARARRAIDERLIDPLINHNQESWALFEGETPRAAAALMTVALLGEPDDRRRWLCLRRILKMLEGHLQNRLPDGGFARGLENHLTECMAVNDCLSMLSVASGGEVELRDEALFVDMARSFVRAHIEGGWFVNPGGQSARPDLSPDLLYRLGENARARELCGLAACLRRESGLRQTPSLTQSTEPLLQQVMNALGRSDLIAQAAREPRPDTVEMTAMNLLAGRTECFYAALAGPSGVGAGDLTLFSRGRPLILPLGGQSASSPHSSVPVINGFEQTPGPGAQDAQCCSGPGYQMLSMNLARAYPPGARVASWQRTLMLSSLEGDVNLMEAFDLDGPGQAVFRFILPDMPSVSGGEVRLAGGEASLSFDPSLRARVDPIHVAGPGGNLAYQLTLAMPDPVPGGNYSFHFAPRRCAE